MSAATVTVAVDRDVEIGLHDPLAGFAAQGWTVAHAPGRAGVLVVASEHLIIADRASLSAEEIAARALCLLARTAIN